MCRKKHKKDQNNGKRGWIGGNPRYNRKKDEKKNKTMGNN